MVPGAGRSPCKVTETRNRVSYALGAIPRPHTCHSWNTRRIYFLRIDQQCVEKGKKQSAELSPHIDSAMLFQIILILYIILYIIHLGIYSEKGLELAHQSCLSW